MQFRMSEKNRGKAIWVLIVVLICLGLACIALYSVHKYTAVNAASVNDGVSASVTAVGAPCASKSDGAAANGATDLNGADNYADSYDAVGQSAERQTPQAAAQQSDGVSPQAEQLTNANFAYTTNVVFGTVSVRPETYNVPRNEGYTTSWSIRNDSGRATIDELTGIIDPDLPGNVTVTMTVTARDGSTVATVGKTVNIGKASLTPEITSANTVVYGETLTLTSNITDARAGSQVWTVAPATTGSDGLPILSGDATILSGTNVLLTNRTEENHAGSVVVTLTVAEDSLYYLSASAQQTVLIEKADFQDATVDILSENDIIYTGRSIVPQFSVSYAGAAVSASNYITTVTGNVSAGMATITLTARSDSENFSGTKTRTFIIGKAPLTVPVPDRDKYEYNAAEQTLVFTEEVDASLIRIDGNKQTTRGNHEATATLLDSSNYKWKDKADGVSTVNIPWEITKGKLDVTFTYNGLTYGEPSGMPVISGIPETETYTMYWTTDSATLVIDSATGEFTPNRAGEVSITVAIDSENYEQYTSNPVTFRVARADFEFAGIEWNFKSTVYNGVDQKVELTSCPAELEIRYENNVQSAVGEYTTYLSFIYSSANYNRPTFPTQYSWSIEKMPITADIIRWEMDGTDWSAGEVKEVGGRGLPVVVSASFILNGYRYTLPVTYTKVGAESVDWLHGYYVATANLGTDARFENFEIQDAVSRDFWIKTDITVDNTEGNASASISGAGQDEWWWYLVMGILALILVIVVVVLVLVLRKSRKIQYIDDYSFDEEGFYDNSKMSYLVRY